MAPGWPAPSPTRVVDGTLPVDVTHTFPNATATNVTEHFSTSTYAQNQRPNLKSPSTVHDQPDARHHFYPQSILTSTAMLTSMRPQRSYRQNCL